MTQFDNRTVQDPKSLIPDVFSRGMPEQMFVQVIEGMGYRENRNIVDELNESWYSKPGTFAVVCSNTFNVNARFDGTGLVKPWPTVGRLVCSLVPRRQRSRL